MAFEIRLVCLFVAAFGFLDASVAVPISDRDQDNEIALFDDLSSNINTIFDEMLPSVREMIIKDGLDPLKMKDIRHELKGIISHDGVLQLTKGWMQGMSQVGRSGDVILTYGDRKITIDAQLELNVMDLAYDYYFKYSLISRKGTFRASMNNVNMRLLLSVDLNSYKIELGSLQVVSVGKMAVKLEGHVLDKVLNAAIKAFLGVFRKEVVGTIEQQGYEVMKKLVERINAKIPKPDLDGRAITYNSDMVDNIPTFFEFHLV
ncbi:uncharacterized protein LOC144471452 [Augochlora pura]